VSLNLLPPWADLAGLLISINDVIYNVGKFFINLKNGQYVKTNLMKSIYKAKLVWNMVD